jgi:hypothetical protein
MTNTQFASARYCVGGRPNTTCFTLPRGPLLAKLVRADSSGDTADRGAGTVAHLLRILDHRRGARATPRRSRPRGPEAAP